MARKKSTNRLYTRAQGKGGVLRYYADLRDKGFGRVALKAAGAGRATDDPEEAQILLGKLMEDIKAGKVPTGPAKPKRQRGDESRLGPMVERFIKDNPKRDGPKALKGKIHLLERAKKEFGAERPLNAIDPHHLDKWWRKLEKAGLSNGTINKHLYALSSLYKYAISLGTYLPVGGLNPIGRMFQKPSARRGRNESQKAVWLEIPDGTKVLNAAKKLERTNRNGLIDFVYPLIATFLLTGGNKAEVLGLTWDDIDFDMDFITFRPNKWRGLKLMWRERVVPLWPQLKPILKTHRKKMKGDGLVFPSPRLAFMGREGMINDVRKIMRDLQKTSKVDLPSGVTIFRHTYATNRLQTTDGGKQISLWTVKNEMGHKTVSLIETTYGHPSQFRPRGEVVEYI